MVRLFAGDGITIPQISNVFEWGQMAPSRMEHREVMPAGRWRPCRQMILTCEQTSHDNRDRPVPLEPRWCYPSTGALETTVVEQTTMEELTVQIAHDWVPPEVPVKLLEMPSNRGGWMWPEAPKITEPLGSSGRQSSGMDGVACILHTTKTQEEEEVKSDLKKGRRMNCPWMSHMSSKKKIDDVASMLLEGPQEGPTTTQNGTPLGTADEEDLIEKKKKKKKNLYYFSNINNRHAAWTKPARQLNRSGMVTQGRAGVVDTALESSCLKTLELYIFQYIYICARNRANKKKKRREREIQVLYILPHIQPEWHTGDTPRRGECKGAC